LEIIKESSDIEIIDTISNNLIYADLEIGDNKSKISTFFEMAINEIYFKDLSIHTGLPPLNQIENSNYTYHNNKLLKDIFKYNYYNSSLSKSYKYIYSCPEYLEDYYYERDVFAQEIIYLLQKNISTTKEMYRPVNFYANFKEFDNYDHCPGVIGLKLKNEFIQRLKELSLINNYNWNIQYTNLLEEKGELIIGDLPHIYDKNAYNENDLKHANIINGNQWSLNFSEIFFSKNEKKYKFEKNETGVFYIEEFFISGTSQYFKLIEDIFFKKYIMDGLCQKHTHKKPEYNNFFYYFMCYIKDDKKREEFFNEFPILTFYQKEMDYKFTLDSNDLFTIIPDNNRILFNIDFNEELKYWILGKPFFKKFHLIFDSESKSISYYIKKNVKKNQNKKISENNIVIIFIIICAFFIGILFGKLIYSKYKKKIRTNELDDVYEYLPNNENK
jgi:hypothetical protein